MLRRKIKKINMENDKNPLSPHLQIYKWQISSLLSITHRIVGVINIFAISLICFWVLFLILGESNYENIKEPPRNSMQGSVSKIEDLCYVSKNLHLSFS